MDEFYADNEEMWPLVIENCMNPDPWVRVASNLFTSAKVLYKRELASFHDRAVLMEYPSFWSWNVIRMLIAYALENLIKAYLIIKNKAEIEESGDLKSVHGHYLTCLFDSAEYEISDQERHYLKLYTFCSIWAARYPLPKEADQLPKQRKSAGTSLELRERFLEMLNRYPNDPRMKYGDFYDLLHVNIGDGEFKCMEDLYNRLSSAVKS